MSSVAAKSTSVCFWLLALLTLGRTQDLSYDAVCGKITSHPKSLILNGKSPDIGNAPWHASLYSERNSPRITGKEYLCGGTIIHSKLILTAAHCVYDEMTRTKVDPGKLFVMTGNTFRNWDSSEHNLGVVKKSAVKNVFLHCRYLGLLGNYVSDIAMIELQEPLNFSSILLPACLDSSADSVQLQPGANGKLAGFGRTEAGNYNNILQTIDLSSISYNQCKASNGNEANIFLSNDKFCTGPFTGKSFCDGVSGAGLVFQNTDQLWYVKGILSISLGVDFVDGERTCNNSTWLYTKVSLYMDWIQNVIIDVEQNKFISSCDTSI